MLNLLLLSPVTLSPLLSSSNLQLNFLLDCFECFQKGPVLVSSTNGVSTATAGEQYYQPDLVSGIRTGLIDTNKVTNTYTQYNVSKMSFVS